MKRDSSTTGSRSSDSEKGSGEKLKAALKKDFDGRFVAAVKEAEAVAPRPPISSMFDDVYEERPWHIEEQARELESKIKRRGEAAAKH